MRTAACSFILAVGFAPALAAASCFSEMTGGDGSYTRQLAVDPKGAIAPILRELSSRGADPQPGSLSIAHLYAMLMDAYDDSGDIEKAAEASRSGLAALQPGDSDGLRRRLQLTGILILDEQGGISAAAREFEAASANVPADAPDMICVLLDRGHLRKRAGHKVDATMDAMRAFHLAQDLGKDDLRVEAGLRLAGVYSEYQLYDEARTLHEDAIRFYEANDDKDGLGITHLLQGEDSLHQGHFREAEGFLTQAKSYYRANATPGDEAVAQVYLCATAVKLDRTDARSVCREALEDANATQYPEGVKMVQGSMGELELKQGHAAAAAGLFDRALVDDKVELTGRTKAEYLNLRGQTRVKLTTLPARCRTLTATSSGSRRIMRARRPTRWRCCACALKARSTRRSCRRLGPKRSPRSPGRRAKDCSEMWLRSRR